MNDKEKKEKWNEDCIFCKIIKKEVPTEILYENDNFLVFPDQNQKLSKGHTLIIPKNHYMTIMDMPVTLGTELLEAMKNAAMYWMEKDKKIEGFNLLMNNFEIAGQFVDHAHFHLIPRRKGDKIKPCS